MAIFYQRIAALRKQTYFIARIYGKRVYNVAVSYYGSISRTGHFHYNGSHTVSCSDHTVKNVTVFNQNRGRAFYCYKCAVIVSFIRRFNKTVMNIYVAYSCAVSYVFANHYAVITKGLAFSGEISERYVFYGADFIDSTEKRRTVIMIRHNQAVRNAVRHSVKYAAEVFYRRPRSVI